MAYRTKTHRRQRQNITFAMRRHPKHVGVCQASKAIGFCNSMLEAKSLTFCKAFRDSGAAAALGCQDEAAQFLLCVNGL